MTTDVILRNGEHAKLVPNTLDTLTTGFWRMGYVGSIHPLNAHLWREDGRWRDDGKAHPLDIVKGIFPSTPKPALK